MDLGDGGSGCDGNCVLEDWTSTEGQEEDQPWFGLSELVCVTVVYVLLMLLGVLGNVLTILVVCLRPHMRSSSYLYLSSMAVSDLLILLLLPLDLYKLWKPRPWPLGDLTCKLTMFLSECCTFSTILHITFLSLERYLAICWPITAKTLLTRHRTRVLIGCLWLAAAVSAAPVLVMVGVEDMDDEGVGFEGWREDRSWTDVEQGQGAFITRGEYREHGWSALEQMKWEEKEPMGWRDRSEEMRRIHKSKGTDQRANQDQMKEAEEPEEEQPKRTTEDKEGGSMDRRECRCTHWALSSGLMSAMMVLSNVYFLVPFCILGVVYSLIGRTLWLRPQSRRRDQKHRHTVKMLGVIVLSFLLCWLPFHVGRTVFFFVSVGTVTDQPPSNPHSNTLSDYENTHTYEEKHYSDTTMEAHTDMSRAAFSHVGLNARTHPQHVDRFTPQCRTHSTDRNNLPNRTTENHPHPTAQTNLFHQTPSSRFPDSAYTHTLFTGTHTEANAHLPTEADAHLPTEADAHLYLLYYLSQYLNLVSSVLFYLSAAINPLLYNLMSAPYRRAVYSLVHKRPHARSQRLHSFTLQHSTTTV